MTTDRELLELAAKAAGIPCKGWCTPGARSDGWSGMYTGNDDDGAYIRWNPLTDDGDALRLAVKLQIDSWFLGEGAIQAARKGRPIQTEVVHEGADPYAATRRAIVRAAAEIGRTM